MRVASRWKQRRERHVSCRSVPFVRVYPGEPWYQKGKTNLDFTEARDSEWQWHQLGHMQVCTSLQTDSHTSTLPLSFLQAGCLSCRPTDSVKALKAKSLTAVYTKYSYKTLSWIVKLFSSRTYRRIPHHGSGGQQQYGTSGNMPLTRQYICIHGLAQRHSNRRQIPANQSLVQLHHHHAHLTLTIS